MNHAMTLTKKSFAAVFATSLTLIVAGCATNAVTGESNFLLVGKDWDLGIGRQQYSPLRQMQGGDYTADPEVEAYVREVGIKLAKQSDVALPYEFNVINSSVPNAWALPGGKISINRGLLTKMNSEAELAAVLGHEIIHAASRHGARGQSKGIVAQVGVVAATVAGSREGYGQLAQLGSTIGAKLVTTKYGRDAELESDLYGMEYMKRAGYDVQGAVDLQRTFVALSEGQQQDFVSGLFSSHPPSQSRVDANIATAERLGTGGIVGKDKYARVMSRLRETEPAYEKFVEAQQAFTKGETAQAKTLVEQAIRIEPRDAHFYSLLGDLAGKKKQWNTAKKNYDKAISLNNDLFYYYLQRGKAYQQSNNMNAARADFEKSIELLPTEDAQLGLADVARLSGDTATANQLYGAIAQGEGKSAEYARQQLVGGASSGGAPVANAGSVSAVEFNQAPGKYLRVRHGRGKDGDLAVELSNTTSFNIDNIILEYRFGNARSGQRSRISGSVSAGRKRVINTGTRLSESQLNQLTVYVRQARKVGG